MCEITERRLKFKFPDGWMAVQYDKTAFHKNHFANVSGSKCVDIVAFPLTGKSLWLIETTDYRPPYKGEKPDGVDKVDTIHIINETCRKVRDTLANLYLARLKQEIEIYEFAKLAAEKTEIRVVLHLEQSAKHSKDHPQVVNWHDMDLKLKKSSLKVVDPHPVLCNMNAMPPKIPWQVSPSPQECNSVK